MSSPVPTTSSTATAKAKVISPAVGTVTAGRQPASESVGTVSGKATKDAGATAGVPLSKAGKEGAAENKETAPKGKAATPAPVKTAAPAGRESTKSGTAGTGDIKSKTAAEKPAPDKSTGKEEKKGSGKKEGKKQKAGSKAKSKKSSPKKGAPVHKKGAPKKTEAVSGESESFRDAAPLHKVLKTEYADATALMAAGHKSRRTDIGKGARLARENINKTKATESAEVTKAYTAAMKTILAAPGKARSNALVPLAKVLNGVQADRTRQKQMAGSVSLQLVLSLSRAATLFSTGSHLFGTKLNEDLQMHGEKLKMKCRSSVFEIANLYKSTEEYGEIIGDLSETAGDFATELDEQNGEIKENISGDSNDLSESLNDDAAEAAVKVNEGLAEAVKSIDEIAEGGAGQFPDFINMVVAELESQAAEMCAQLITSMGHSIAAIASQAQVALQEITKQENQVLADLDQAYALRKKTMAESMAEVDKEVPHLPDTLAIDLIEDARNGIRETLAEDKSSGDEAVKNTVAAFEGTAGEFSAQMKAGSQSIGKEMQTLGTTFTDAAMTSLESSMNEVRSKINEQMAEVVNKFRTEMTSAVAESLVRLQNKFSDAVVEIAVKAGKAKNAMDDSFAETRQSMATAAYKIVNDTWLDKIGDFLGGLISGIFEFLAGVILAIVAIVVAIIAVVVALVVIVAALVLLVKLLVVLVGYALAVLVALLPYALKLVALYFIVDGAMSLYRGIKLIYEALTTPGLTFSERISMIGQGLLEIATAVPLGKVLKVFKLGTRFTKYTAKVYNVLKNSRAGKAIVEVAQNSFDFAGTILNKLGGKATEMIERLLSGGLDKLTGRIWDKLVKGKWTGPILQKAKAQYDKIMGSRIGKSADDIAAISRGEIKELAEQKIRSKLSRELAEKTAAGELRQSVAAEIKKDIKRESRRRRRGRKNRDQDSNKDRKKEVLDWKNRKYRFVSKIDRRSHTLYFRGMRKSEDIIMESRPVVLLNYLDSLKGDPTYKNSTASILSAQKLAGEIRAVTSLHVNKRKSGTLVSKMTSLAAKMAYLTGEPPLPSRPQWSAQDGPSSKFSHVFLLTSRVQGSSSNIVPGASPHGWPLILQWGINRSQKGIVNWVRMHMITAQLGGSGQSDNLIPAPSSINTGKKVLFGFEKDTMALLRARNGNNSNVIWIKTDVTKFHPPLTVNGNSYSFAQTLAMRAGMHFYDIRSGKWERDTKSHIFYNVAIPRPDASDQNAPSINVVGTKLLHDIAGISHEFARYFIETRHQYGFFSTVGQVDMALKAYWLKNNRSETDLIYVRNKPKLLDALRTGKFTFNR